MYPSSEHLIIHVCCFKFPCKFHVTNYRTPACMASVALGLLGVASHFLVTPATTMATTCSPSIATLFLRLTSARSNPSSLRRRPTRWHTRNQT